MTTVLLGLALGLGAPALKDKPTSPSLEGEWEVEGVTTGGRPSKVAPGLRYTFTPDGKWLISRDGQALSPQHNRTVVVDAKPNPPTVDMVSNANAANSSRLLGIYKVEGDTLTICGTRGGAERPSSFDSPDGSAVTTYVLKRVKKD